MGGPSDRQRENVFSGVSYILLQTLILNKTHIAEACCLIGPKEGTLLLTQEQKVLTIVQTGRAQELQLFKLPCPHLKQCFLQEGGCHGSQVFSDPPWHASNLRRFVLSTEGPIISERPIIVAVSAAKDIVYSQKRWGILFCRGQQPFSTDSIQRCVLICPVTRR